MLSTLAERRCLPDAVIRMGIRRLLACRLAEEAPRSSIDEAQRKPAIRRLFAEGPVACATDAAREQHYEVPTELFEYMLGPRLKYSCCLWDNGVRDLAAAEDAMLDLTCHRAEIRDGQRILDLGCGWGSASLWLAENFPNADIVAASNSRTQHRYLQEQARRRGLRNVQHCVLNMADLTSADGHERMTRAIMRTGQRAGAFDRIVSVEMFEHMFNVELLLNRLNDWLTPAGMLFVHIFSHPRLFYRFEDKGANSWMARNFFTGGAMPAVDLFEHVYSPFNEAGRWLVNGVHYAKTCRAWLERLDARRAEAEACLADHPSELPAARQLQRWRMFLMACEELFAFQRGNEWLVSHHLLTKA